MSMCWEVGKEGRKATAGGKFKCCRRPWWLQRGQQPWSRCGGGERQDDWSSESSCFLPGVEGLEYRETSAPSGTRRHLACRRLWAGQCDQQRPDNGLQSQSTGLAFSKVQLGKRTFFQVDITGTEPTWPPTTERTLPSLTADPCRILKTLTFNVCTL